MANNLQRIFDEVKATVTNTDRARQQSDVLNVTGSVLQLIVDKFGEAWPNWLLETGSFTQSASTKDLGGSTFDPPLYDQRVKDLWILDIGRIPGPKSVVTFDPMLSSYPTGLPGVWGWSSWQKVQFDYIPSSYTIQIRYQREVEVIDSQTPLTNQPDIPGFDGFNLLLMGVKAIIKLDTASVDALEQNAIWQQQWNSFFDKYAVEDEGQLELSYS